LPKGQNSRFFVAYCICVDDDSFLLILGRCIDFGTVAPLDFVAASHVEKLPIFFTEIVHEGVEVVGASFGIFFLEVKQQLQRVRLDE
jgi:hypothetical protein